MSNKEPALRLLRERYAESFALTRGKGRNLHLFMIKQGLWSLVWTFTPRELGSNEITFDDVLYRLESALKNKDFEILRNLDSSVAKATERIKSKVKEFS